jgi:signal transduction histidine kinase
VPKKLAVKTDIHVLFISACTADETVLTTLLGKERLGQEIRISASRNAQAFFDAVHSEELYQVIVIDDRQPWATWQSVVETCAKSRPNALLVLLGANHRDDRQESALTAGIAAVYPRTSAGLIALAKLVSKLAVQGGSFSLRMDRQLADAKKEDSPEQERERLAYAVSHDLQDPLQLARRYAEVLDEDFEDALGDSGAKVLGHLKFNLNRTQEMLDELLDYSRLQNAKPDLQPVDFNELLDEVVDLYRLSIEEVGATINCQHSLPTLIVDRRQFQRVFQNLIGNAIKFRSERPLRITVRAQRVRNEWRIGVKDNGIGIAEQDAGRIFEMFERSAGSEDHPGTGMGLAICKRILQNHGGKIWVRSSPGSGSVFIFSVPQAGDSATLTGG